MHTPSLPLLHHSLRGKITLGYLAVALLMLIASFFFVSELRTLEQRVITGQRVSDLFDTTLEIRRFERNFFLHRQDIDARENSRYIDTAEHLLQTRHKELLAVTTAARLQQLQDLLGAYRRQMSAGAAMAGQPQADRLEPEIRALGKEIIRITEDMAHTERQQIQSSLATLRNILIASIAFMAALILLLGRIMSQRVVKPLKAMESSMNSLSARSREPLQPPSNDREIVSIINTINHMLTELDLRQTSLMRSERLASLGTMLSGVAHELNNPLSNISSSCQILQEELGHNDLATQQRFLAQIDQQTVRARNIVRALLDFAREREFQRQNIRLKSLLEQTVGFVRGEIPAGSQVQLDIPDNLSLLADSQRLQQIFVNLIRNAMQVLPPDGLISISARALQAAGAPREHSWGSACGFTGAAVEISIADNGPGIAADILPRLFDPFFTTKDVGQGMGLGLFIVYEIIDEHGGCISVNSQPGQGARFTILLPQPESGETPK